MGTADPHAWASVMPTRNALYSMGQVLVSTLSAFATYAVVARELGVAMLGIWSVAVAICAFVAIADAGIGGAMVRFVAMYRSSGEISLARSTAVTALGSVAIATATAALLGYVLASAVVDRLVPAHERHIAHDLLPFAMLTAALNAVSETVLGGLEGCERYQLRAGAVVLGSLTLITTILVGLPVLGVDALGIAFAAQALVVLVLGVFFLARTLRIGASTYPSFRPAVLLPLLAMGWRLKAMGLFNLLLDPVTKLLVLRAGGSEMSGLFEMAARLPAQLRAVMIAALQVTVPRFAGLPSEDRLLLYRGLVSVALLGGLAAFSTLLLALPLLSTLLLARMDPVFLALSGLMALAWFVNVQSAPAYFAYVGTGELRWNLFGHMTMGLLNILLGYIGGQVGGSIGVVAGTCAAICIGSSLPTIAFGVRFGQWPLPSRRADWMAAAVSIVVVIAWESAVLGGVHGARTPIISGVSAAVFGFLALGFLLRHPALARLRG